MAVYKTVNVLPKVIEDVSEQIGRYSGRTVIWFGYTAVADVIQKILAAKGKGIDFVIDNDRRKWGFVSYGGIMVSPPEHVLVREKSGAVVFILSNYADSMVRQVKSCGYADSEIVVFPSPENYAGTAEFEEDVSRLNNMTLRELQLCELDILKTLRDFCGSNGLRYYLAGGTCFGAVNYKGFVPWDDDIDIYMPYEDYNALIKYFPGNGRYEVVSWDKYDSFFWPYAQLVDNETVMIYKSMPLSARQSVFIDIIPLTGWPEDAGEIKYRVDMNRFLESKWRYYHYSQGVIDTPGNRRDILADIIKRRYDLPFETSANSATAVELWGGEEQWILPRPAFDYGKTLTFEGEEFSAAMDWPEYLRLRARKYEGKPQSEIQVSHPIMAYRK